MLSSGFNELIVSLAMDKEDRRRIKQLLTDAVLVLCKASLRYRRKFTVEGLLGITLDSDEVHLININELIEKDEEECRPNGRDNHDSKRSSTIHQGASVMTRPVETPSGRSMQEISSRIAEKRPSTSENEISEKRRRQDDMPVDLARVKTEVAASQRNADGAVDLSGAADKTATMNEIAASAVRAVQQGLAQSMNPASMIHPRFPQQISTPRPRASVPPFNNYAQFSLTPGLSPFRGRPRLSAAVNSPMDTVCTVCNFRCNTKTELYNHANTMKCKICPCPHCPKSFCDPGKLNQHITVRHEEPKFGCPLCGHRYSTKQNMQIHIRRHHGDQLYMQMMVQQSVRFHGPNSPIPGVLNAGQNAGILDFPFTPGPGEDSLEVTSQSEDEDGSYHAPHSPVNITPTTSYASMPLFPDQQPPVPISQAVTTPDQANDGQFPNLSQAISNELEDDNDDDDPNDRDADDESEKGLDLHVPSHSNHHQPLHNSDQPMSNKYEEQDQPLNMRYNQDDHRDDHQDDRQKDRQDDRQNDRQDDRQNDQETNGTDQQDRHSIDDESNHTNIDDKFDNPPELTLSSELTL